MSIFSTIIKGIAGNSTVTINGKTYTGSSIQISNNKVVIDGKEIEDESRTVIVNITGDVDRVDTASGDVNVTGNVNSVESTSGDIEIGGNVDGNVKSTSGDVSVKGSISGNVSTISGDIEH